MFIAGIYYFSLRFPVLPVNPDPRWSPLCQSTMAYSMKGSKALIIVSTSWISSSMASEFNNRPRL